MQKVGLHFNYWNGTGAEQDVYRALTLCAEAGAEVFECGTGAILSMTPQQRIALGRACKEAGMYITVNGGLSETDLSSPDEALRKRSIALAQNALHAVADTGSAVWSGVIYSRWLGMPSEPFTAMARQNMWDRAQTSLQNVLETAKSCGVTICFEIVNRFEAYLLTTAREGIKFTEALESPHAKLLLDVFHMNIEEDYIAEAIEDAAAHGKLGHLHVSESNRRLPGLCKTDLNWNEILGSVRKSGYDGAVILEPMVLMEAPRAAEFRTWRNMTENTAIENLLLEARRSIDFVRKTLRSGEDGKAQHTI